MVIIDLVPGFSTTQIVERSQGADRAAAEGGRTVAAQPPQHAVGWLTPTPTKEARPTLVEAGCVGRQDTAAHETQFPFGISQRLIAFMVICHLK